MAIPPGFHFSQASLQDFLDCPMRFKYRYLDHLAWPAVESEPALEQERFMLQGQRFHHLVHQHHAGLDAAGLSALAMDGDLAEWWKSYCRWTPALFEGLERARFYPEVQLSAELCGHRLLAKYDLVAVCPEGRLLIIDWKTSHKKPSRALLANRMQTRLYPYLLVRAGGCLRAGEPLAPEQVEMIYWYTSQPELPVRLPYSRPRYQEDESFLGSLMDHIASLSPEDFRRAGDSRPSRFCVYRSLCDREVAPGNWDELEDGDESMDEGVELDFEQVAEIAF